MYLRLGWQVIPAAPEHLEARPELVFPRGNPRHTWDTPAVMDFISPGLHLHRSGVPCVAAVLHYNIYDALCVHLKSVCFNLQWRILLYASFAFECESSAFIPNGMATWLWVGMRELVPGNSRCLKHLPVWIWNLLSVCLSICSSLTVPPQLATL